VVLAALVLAACQGRPSGDTPIHLNPNMDDQEKLQAQEASQFFEDGFAMRIPPEGTVARGQLREDDAFYRGRDAAGNFVTANPVPVTLPILKRGRERFNIYCSPCHGCTGDGRGIMVTRGYVPPPTFHSKRIRWLPDGHLFEVITNGVRNMPAYRGQVPERDRWAIIAFVRALERSQNARLADVPEEKRHLLK
jgi:mono/diheme cytochrome c family protein